jgi:hypothetical protein
VLWFWRLVAINGGKSVPGALSYIGRHVGSLSSIICRAQHIDKGSDRTTRRSEPSDVAVIAVTATHFRWLPAFRRSIHRPHTRGQLPIRGTATWQRVCMLFRTRRACVSIDRNRQSGRNLVSFFGALVAVLLVLNSHLKPSPSSWRLRTPPHGSGRGKW